MDTRKQISLDHERYNSRYDDHQYKCGLNFLMASQASHEDSPCAYGLNNRCLTFTLVLQNGQRSTFPAHLPQIPVCPHGTRQSSQSHSKQLLHLSSSSRKGSLQGTLEESFNGDRFQGHEDCASIFSVSISMPMGANLKISAITSYPRHPSDWTAVWPCSYRICL